MSSAGTNRILTINSGSSSLKLALYEIGEQENLILAVNANRIGHTLGRLTAIESKGAQVVDVKSSFSDQPDALRQALRLIEEKEGSRQICGICHRVVHGGAKYDVPQLITPDLVAELRKLVPIDPDHLPQAISDIEMLSRKYPDVPQIACFDTAFHRTMPRVAQLCPLPMKYFDQGILRYGFHGISYEYILAELRSLDGGSANGRIVVAHLGNGASMAAIKDGRCLDTTMGFTPTSGLLMGTRSGDIDPGVILYLQLVEKMHPEDIDRLLNKQAGLLGISGTSPDMQELLAEERTNARVAEAIALFCYRARKYLAAFVAVLGGLDTVVFTAGIGEHAAIIRERICTDFELFGIQIDGERNRRNASEISSEDSRVKVRVIKTNENLMMARHAAAVLKRTVATQRSR
jgi:acetate kinase